LLSGFIIKHAEHIEEELYEGRKYINKEIKLTFIVKEIDDNGYCSLEVTENRKIYKIIGEYHYDEFYIDIPKGKIDKCKLRVRIDGSSVKIREDIKNNNCKTYYLHYEQPFKKIKEITITRIYPYEAEIWAIPEIVYNYTITSPTFKVIVEVEIDDNIKERFSFNDFNVDIKVYSFDGLPLPEEDSVRQNNIKENPNIKRYIITRGDSPRFYIFDRLTVTISFPQS
jgi:hypothetical protein